MAGSTYLLRPLTADGECPRNIARVRAPGCREALAQIFNAISCLNGSINAAVWIDGEPAMDDGQRAVLDGWCQIYGMATPYPVLISAADDFKALGRLFNRQASRAPREERERVREILKPFEAHISSRIKALNAQFPDKEVRLSVRASLQETTAASAKGGNPHVDLGGDAQYRFIETLAGGATCLVDSEQVSYGGGFAHIKMKDGAPTFWQVPEGAIAFLSSMNNARRPVMHCAPPREEIGAGKARIVVIYDLVDRKPSLLARITGLSR